MHFYEKTFAQKGGLGGLLYRGKRERPPLRTDAFGHRVPLTHLEDITMSEFNEPACDCESTKDSRFYSNRRFFGTPACIECVVIPPGYVPSNDTCHPMTYEDIIHQLTERDGYQCQGCGIDQSLVVDHDHDSGKIRGFLCQRCNIFVGYIEKTPGHVLSNLSRYIAAHN